jgi:hypothetical protein
MVTAIVIPIICLYFFWVTKKERLKFKEEWKSIGTVSEEAMIEGEVTRLHLKKERYYQHLHMWVLEIRLQTAWKTILAQKLQTADEDYRKPGFEEGDTITLFGKWQKDIFIVNRTLLQEGRNRAISEGIED